MLKVWKDSSRSMHLDSCQDGDGELVRQTGVDPPTIPLETASASLTPPGLDLNTVSLKRARQSSNQDDSDTRSSKRTQNSVPAHPKRCYSTAPFTSVSADELLEFAKTRNSKLARTSKSPY